MTTLLFTVPVEAQRITGQVRGKVCDPSLAGLPGVTVELTSDNIIGTRTTVTTDRGDYRFITLPPGFYDLTFRHPDFKTEELRHVHVAVGTTTRKDVTLNLATMADTVDVTAEMRWADGLPPSDLRLGRSSSGERAQSKEGAPISIAAFDAPALENRTMYDLSDLADFTPNLEFASSSLFGGTSNISTVYIRGIGQLESGQWFDPGVGIYLDGVYLALTRGTVLNLIDVEVVEVLRGPQDTLFGKNTFGGAISIVTRKPGGDLAGHIELRAGNFDRLDGSARVSGGVLPGLFASLSVASTNADGFTRSLATGEDYDDDNTVSARMAWRWHALDSVTVDWAVDASRERERGTARILTGVQPTDVFPDILAFYNNALTLAGRQPYDERWVTGNLRDSYATSPSFANSDGLGTSLDVDALLNTNLSVRSIASYHELDTSESKDVDGTPNDLIKVSYDTDQRQWSEEVWLSGLSVNGRLTWTLGGLYFEERPQMESRITTFGDLFETLEAVPGPFLAPPGEPAFLCDPDPRPGVPCYGGPGNPLNSKLLYFSQPSIFHREPATRSYALFGEATFDLGAKLSLTAGLRYNHEEKEFLSRFQSSKGEADSRSAEKSWGSPTARFSLAFQATPDAMLYVAATKGFRSGGFSDHAVSRARPFAPERVWSYEAGFKADHFSDRLRVHAAFFWNDYTDLQLSIWAPPSGNLIIGSAGDAVVKGFDVSFRARFSDDFLVDAGVGHLDAAYTRLESEAEGFNVGREFPRTPEWNIVFSPEYVLRLRNGGAVVLHGDYTYKTRVFFDVANSTSQGAYGLVNVRASLLLPSGAWEAYVYGTNLADQEYKEHGSLYEGFGLSSAVAGRPREWGVGLRYRF